MYEVNLLESSVILRFADRLLIELHVRETTRKLLKNYFSEGKINKDGDEISTIEIKKTLKQIIESEDKTKP